MKSEMVIYNGRPVPKDGFRVFIYGADGKQKLVNSWIEYQSNIESGLWFSTKEAVIEKSKSKKKGE
jgi:hypothetical protein